MTFQPIKGSLTSSTRIGSMAFQSIKGSLTSSTRHCTSENLPRIALAFYYTATRVKKLSKKNEHIWA